VHQAVVAVGRNQLTSMAVLVVVRAVANTLSESQVVAVLAEVLR
jgi:hypothetical protein